MGREDQLRRCNLARAFEPGSSGSLGVLSAAMEPVIRHANLGDLARINEVYNEYIIGRHTSFDTEPWTFEQRQQWFENYVDETGRLQALVLELAGRVVGFASSSPFRNKAAYASSIETTVVLDETAVGKGLGGTLLAALLECVADTGVHRAYALIALPNEPSITVHSRLGYREVGVLNEVGRKLGEYWSVLIMERSF